MSAPNPSPDANNPLDPQLVDFVLNELDAEKRAELDRRIAGNVDGRREVERLQKLTELLRESVDDELSRPAASGTRGDEPVKGGGNGLREVIQQHLAEEISQSSVASLPPRRRRVGWRSASILAVSLAILLVAGVGAFLWMESRTSQPRYIYSLWDDSPSDVFRSDESTATSHDVETGDEDYERQYGDDGIALIDESQPDGRPVSGSTQLDGASVDDFASVPEDWAKQQRQRVELRTPSAVQQLNEQSELKRISERISSRRKDIERRGEPRLSKAPGGISSTKSSPAVAPEKALEDSSRRWDEVRNSPSNNEGRIKSGNSQVDGLETANKLQLGGDPFAADVAEAAGESIRESASAESYEPIVENSFIAVQGQAALTTFSIDVDTASYSNARRFLMRNQLPPANAVRVEEFVNYFQYDYPLPQRGEAFTASMHVAECPWQRDHRLLRIALKGREIPRDDRPPSNLVFLIDVSGSMADNNKLPLLRESMKLLVSELDERDRVSVVTYAGEAGLRLPPTSGEQQTKIRRVIDSLSAGGSTHGSAGIMLAYQQATESFLDEGTNRVILATDGDLNVGVTSDDALVQLIKDQAASGVFLSVLGFGTGNLKDSKLEKLADNGNGMYAYVDSLREGRRVLVEQITGSLVTIAKDVKIQIEFNPAAVAAYRLIGYENRALANEDFDDDRKDAGEIGAGHTVTAFYEFVPPGVELEDDDGEREPSAVSLKYQRTSQPEQPREAQLTEASESGELLTLRIRYKRPDSDHSQRLEFTVDDTTLRFDRAPRDFQFAAAVASFAMLLRSSQYSGSASLAAIEEIASGAAGDDPDGYRAEFLELVRRAAQLSP